MTGLTRDEQHLTDLAYAVRAEKGAATLELPEHCVGPHLLVSQCAGGYYVQYGKVFGAKIGVGYRDARANLLDMLRN